MIDQTCALGLDFRPLDTTLAKLPSSIGRLCDLLAELRDAAVDGELDRLLGVTTQVEVAGVRFAHLLQLFEQQLREATEQTGATDLAELATQRTERGEDGAAFLATWEEVQRQLQRLREENSQTATFLTAAIQVAQSIQTHLSQSGAGAHSYGRSAGLRLELGVYGPYPARQLAAVSA